MEDIGILVIVAAVGFAAFSWIRKDPRMTREVVLRSIGLMVVYFLFAGVGLAITFSFTDGPQPQDRAVALTLFMGAWILFGGLWLMRLVPRFAEPPAWLMRRWGIADLVMLLLMAGSLAYALLI